MKNGYLIKNINERRVIKHILFVFLFVAINLTCDAATVCAQQVLQNSIASISHIKNINDWNAEAEPEVTADGFSGNGFDDELELKDFAIEKKVVREESVCIKFDDVKGSGKYPYNFRMIDNKLCAGGNLFNPITQGNSAERVKKYILFLKVIGVKHIIALNVPAHKTRELDMISGFCKELEMNLYQCRMNSETVPSEEQTKKIMAMIDEGAYVHCNWGCDRTGTIIAKYLVLKKGYTGEEAFRAVISKGTHSGLMGGLKQTPTYKKLVLYFWPEMESENPEVASKYEMAQK